MRRVAQVEHTAVTGLLREEAGGLWTSLAAERKRFRQNVV